MPFHIFLKDIFILHPVFLITYPHLLASLIRPIMVAADRSAPSSGADNNEDNAYYDENNCHKSAAIMLQR